MARTRYRSDPGLIARMGLTMFMLGLVFVAFGVGLVYLIAFASSYRHGGSAHQQAERQQQANDAVTYSHLISLPNYCFLRCCLRLHTIDILAYSDALVNTLIMKDD